MFDIWRLKYRRWRVQAAFNKETEALRRKKATLAEVDELETQEYFEIRNYDEEINRLNALKLWRNASALDLEVPDSSNPEMWTYSEDGERRFLSTRGRAHVRQLIDAEKARRFEIKTMWVTKIILPVVASLVGILGAITGLVAVLHRK